VPSRLLIMVVTPSREPLTGGHLTQIPKTPSIADILSGWMGAEEREGILVGTWKACRTHYTGGGVT